MFYDILVAIFVVLAQFSRHIFSINDHMTQYSSSYIYMQMLISQSNDVLLFPKLTQATDNGLLGSIMPVRSKKRRIHTPRSRLRLPFQDCLSLSYVCFTDISMQIFI